MFQIFPKFLVLSLKKNKSFRFFFFFNLSFPSFQKCYISQPHKVREICQKRGRMPVGLTAPFLSHPTYSPTRRGSAGSPGTPPQVQGHKSRSQIFSGLSPRGVCVSFLSSVPSLSLPTSPHTN